MKTPFFSEDDLVRSICRESFYRFVQEFWHDVIPEDPVWNWHIKFLCDEMQEMAERVFRKEEKTHDEVINISPGTTKSTICSVMFPAWVWTRMPTARFITASYGADLALDLGRKSRNLVESERYQRIFSIGPLSTDQNAKGHFENKDKGARYSIGIGGMITGKHAHFILIDDPIDPKRAISPVELKAVNRWMDETITSRKVDKKVSVTILIMQRLHQNDPTGHILTKSMKEGASRVRHICLPAKVTADVKPLRLKLKYKDGLMDPVRLSKKVLEEFRANMGEYGFSSQFLQSPIPLGGGMFKVERFVYDVPSVTLVSVVRYWDKAGSAGKGAYTVGLKLGKDVNGRYWILDVIRGQWSSEEREQIILATAQMDGVGVVIGIEQEPGSGGKESAEATVRRLAGYRVRVDRPVGDKALRADPFSVQVNSGNVSILKGKPWKDELVEEFRFFPYSTYKDQVDAASGAFSLITNSRRKVGAF
jgi:predicted phage terminase large subunit-like protein